MNGRKQEDVMMVDEGKKQGKSKVACIGSKIPKVFHFLSR